MSFDGLLNSLCGKDNWVAYCINLTRATERREKLTAWAQRVGLTFKFFQASDKLCLTKEERELCDVIVNFEKPSIGATACRASHHRLLMHMKEAHPNMGYYFILEDDAGFVDFVDDYFRLVDFCLEVKEQSLQWDHIWFGYLNGIKVFQKPLSTQVCEVVRTHVTHAMLIKAEQVDHLLFLLQVHNYKQLPVDWIYDLLRSEKFGTTIGPYQSIIHQTDSFTFIWQ